MRQKFGSLCLNWLINIVLLMATIFLVLFVAEIHLRIFYVRNFHPDWEISGFHLPDPELIYFPRPSVFEDGRRITNSLGLRNEEILPKSQEVFRIITLGDSFTWGYEVESEDAYPKVLEELLKTNRGINIEVINAGIQGFGTDQEYRLFIERLVELEPDLLLVALSQNDYTYDNITKALYTIKNDKLVPLDARKHWLYIQGTLFHKAPDWLRRSYLFDYFLTSLRGRDPFGLIPKLSEKGLFDWASDKAIKEIVNLNSLGKERGFRLIVIVHPISSLFIFKDEGFSEAFVRSYLEKIEKELIKNGIVFIDINKDLLSWTSANSQSFPPTIFGVLGEKTINYEELFVPDDRYFGERHLTVLGNEVFAELVFQEIPKYLH